MKGRKNILITAVLVLAVSFVTSSVTMLMLTNYYARVQFQRLGDVCQEIINEEPELQPVILEVLKEYKEKPFEWTDENILRSFGYQEKHFLGSTQRCSAFIAGIVFLLGVILFLTVLWFWHRKEVIRIQTLTAYLEKVNAGTQGLLLSVEEDEFSKLQDEIYKTVTNLYQTRDAAVEAKNNYADNLSNIAHQLKTPVTAISLCAQMIKKNPSGDYPAQIQGQIKRLTHLEESLLLLSRIDAGTLVLKKEAVDIFTLLTLAADNLQELFVQAGVFIDIPEMENMEITADLDWTMEAVMNLLKNCMEHTPEGKMVHCSCEKNPLYTQITIWDEGPGFYKDDIPHLFERFYRGKDANDSGIGIGLSLAKEIIEMQSGVISAGNIRNAGACFEVRFYSH